MGDRDGVAGGARGAVDDEPVERLVVGDELPGPQREIGARGGRKDVPVPRQVDGLGVHPQRAGAASVGVGRTARSGAVRRVPEIDVA